MRERATTLPGVRLFEPSSFPDERGYFMETYHQQRYMDLGLTAPFVQDNFSHSVQGTLRGFHYQLLHPQAKLVQVLRGEVFDVALDIRTGSPTFGEWFGTTLSGENHVQLFIPEGFAHAFCVVSESADFAYKVTANYAPGDEYSLLWNDPDLAIPWPLTEAPKLSPKDAVAPRLADAVSLPKYG